MALAVGVLCSSSLPMALAVGVLCSSNLPMALAVSVVVFIQPSNGSSC